jgi:hypothetical protein
MERRTFLLTGAALVIPRPSMDEAICKADGGSSVCRYFDNNPDGQIRCLKLSPSHRKIIDEEVADYIACGGDLSMVPFGDNCEGRYPTLETIVDQRDTNR